MHGRQLEARGGASITAPTAKVRLANRHLMRGSPAPAATATVLLAVLIAALDPALGTASVKTDTTARQSSHHGQRPAGAVTTARSATATST